MILIFPIFLGGLIVVGTCTVVVYCLIEQGPRLDQPEEFQPLQERLLQSEQEPIGRPGLIPSYQETIEQQLSEGNMNHVVQ